MSLFEKFKDIQTKSGEQTPSKDVLQTTKNWFNDRYEWMQIQRNILLVVVILCAITISILTASVSFIKSSRTIEPFVIEIEPKTGVPTVVDPETLKAYKADEAVQRHLVWDYVKAREEYFVDTFKLNSNEVRVMSSQDEFSSYRRENGVSNPQSPFNTLANSSSRVVNFNSMIITDLEGDKKLAEVRFKSVTTGARNEERSRLARVVFQMSRNLEMSDEDRLINPLGFFVIEYRVTDEKI